MRAVSPEPQKGYAAEWYQDNWAFRLGRMTGPKEPKTDFQISKHYGDQVELERAHTLSGQPGKVRLLAWRNRAVLATFKDERRGSIDERPQLAMYSGSSC